MQMRTHGKFAKNVLLGRIHRSSIAFCANQAHLYQILEKYATVKLSGSDGLRKETTILRGLVANAR